MCIRRKQLLRLALPLVRTHGFSREALSRSVLSLPEPHPAPLNETAVSALFGKGEDARRTLIEAWLSEGLADMKNAPSKSLKDILSHRLRYNEPVLGLLPEAFATLATPSGFCLFDASPALKHSTSIADEACSVSEDKSIGPLWYARRASLAAVYTAAELHQMNSPDTAYEFLADLLQSSSKLGNAIGDVGQFASYVGRSWAGIIKSRGVLL
ncbi:hypothetical protein BDY19DRAFT_886259 [Irpex rosettiformis]|uniref:Uncharacterized protein n=1 Tax=Irpex rosettiformis TaxID=378272 RepID=A0ACB8UAL9_9APHY|nr:hypothetical protein BDY19DRAFT_886259 [Irpex rosettiformis]